MICLGAGESTAAPLPGRGQAASLLWTGHCLMAPLLRHGNQKDHRFLCQFRDHRAPRPNPVHSRDAPGVRPGRCAPPDHWWRSSLRQTRPAFATESFATANGRAALVAEERFVLLRRCVALRGLWWRIGWLCWLSLPGSLGLRLLRRR